RIILAPRSSRAASVPIRRRRRSSSISRRAPAALGQARRPILQLPQQLQVPEPAILSFWIDLLHRCEPLREAEIAGDCNLAIHAILHAGVIEIAQRPLP